MSILRRLFGSSRDAAIRKAAPPPAPEQAVYAIGDIHGMSALLKELLANVRTDVQMTGSDRVRTIVLGDMIDRGEDSAGVLSLLHALSQDQTFPLTVLLGNHEEMLLDFLDRPAERGRRWLRNGGLQTLASYRLGGLTETADGPALEKAAAALAEALGKDLIDWLSSLPRSWNSGTLWAVHAAADPDIPMLAQNPETLTWGHGGFLRKARSDGLWVVHGHTPVDVPVAADSRISVDTGAYYSGKLTAARIGPDGSVRFLSSSANR